MNSVPVKDKVQGVVAHVGKTEDIAALILAAETKFGHVNVLVNNAGTNPYFGPIVDSDEKAWDKTFEVNLKGPYTLARILAKKMMLAGGGSIVNIASVAGLEAAPMQGIYSVTKAGLIMLTKVMARECGRKGVRVNCICPGVIKTHLSETLWKDEERLKAILGQKVARPHRRHGRNRRRSGLLRLGRQLIHHRGRADDRRWDGDLSQVAKVDWRRRAAGRERSSIGSRQNVSCHCPNSTDLAICHQACI